MKLTKAQSEVMRIAKKEIDGAREFKTFKEFYENKKHKRFETVEEFKAEWKQSFDLALKWWELNRQAIVLTQAKKETVQKLESFGLIEIIEIAQWSSGCDRVKVLNY